MTKKPKGALVGWKPPVNEIAEKTRRVLSSNGVTEKPKAINGSTFDEDGDLKKTYARYYPVKEMDAWLEERDAKLCRLVELCETGRGRCSLYPRANMFFGKTHRKERKAHSGVPAIRWIGMQIKAALRGGQKE